MNAQQRELFRFAILRVLEANNTRFGLSAETIAVFMGQHGFKRPNTETVEEELLYLRDKGFAEQTEGKSISPENKTWRITANGRDELATNG